MEIGFIYPDLDADSFVESIDSFNGEISVENLKTFLPRFIVFISDAALYVVWFFIVRVAYFKLVYAITAKGTEVILFSLILFLLVLLASLAGMATLRKLIRPYLLRLMRGSEAQESYSFSDYVERSDPEKKVRTKVGFYKMCDTLKRSNILDATAVCDGVGCRVEVQFEADNDSSVFTFYLPYHESSGLSSVIVDLNRKCVIFPEEVKRNED